MTFVGFGFRLSEQLSVCIEDRFVGQSGNFRLAVAYEEAELACVQGLNPRELLHGFVIWLRRM